MKITRSGIRKDSAVLGTLASSTTVHGPTCSSPMLALSVHNENIKHNGHIGISFMRSPEA